ncbi:MAG: glycosyltransferase family 2 protein [Deltaproteobacteria bacterium]|nr:glycosyltransferase family 2 protein [Deltaproteobacteria bacterium]
MNRAYVLLINWNGWADTIECLESLFRSTYGDFRVIVCDNHSEDNSVEYIKAWAESRLDLVPKKGNDLFRKSFPPVVKPISYVEYSQEEAERGGMGNENDAALIIIKNRKNLGFAGGNNVGLRYALQRDDFDYIWLLNNDTVVEPDALESLIVRMKERPDAGMCGSTLLYYDDPSRVQALGGGYYSKWIGLPWHLGRLKKAKDVINVERVEAWMNYVVGASMLVSKQFLRDIGLMCEDYFLYFEETDWGIRAEGHYKLAYAPKSIVYHKVGRSIGTSSYPMKKSLLCDYYNIRNRLFFTRRYYPLALPTIYFMLLITLTSRMVLLKWDRVKMIIRLMMDYDYIPSELRRT